MIMFDSLNRRLLPPYGCDWIHAPNFARLARYSVTFENSYAGSLPCMPSRREIHTGRYNFLHRTWGPIEPYDDSMPEILKQNGIHSHLVSDHYHYWEDGGSTYHNRYTTWEMSRGQEGDLWRGEVKPQRLPDSLNLTSGRPERIQDMVNRRYMPSDSDTPQAKTFAAGEEFIRTNYQADNWFLHIETFDPHEPFFTHEEYKRLYPHRYTGKHWDWPTYTRVNEGADAVEHLRMEYAALLSKCDRYLGRILQLMDEYRLWDDTLLIINTDHGFLLGEHGWWAKCVMPFYNEVAHTPFFVWDPRLGIQGERRSSLVQTIDIPATVLEFFGLPLPADMQGVPLRDVIETDSPGREAVLFGIHGGHMNCTDGRFVYMRGPQEPDNQPLYEYGLMPTRHGRDRAFVEVERLQEASLMDGFSFTKGCPLLRIPGRAVTNPHPFGTMLFDLEQDPSQEFPIDSPTIERQMTDRLAALMESNDAPREQWERLGL